MLYIITVRLLEASSQFFDDWYKEPFPASISTRFKYTPVKRLLNASSLRKT